MIYSSSGESNEEENGDSLSILVIAVMLLSTTLIVFGMNTAKADQTVSLPGAPTGLTSVPGNGQVTLNWIPPASDGGSDIEYYIIFQNGNEVSNTTNLTINIGEWGWSVSQSFTVAAHNAAGTGPQSNPVAAFVAPNAPIFDNYLEENGQVTLYFEPSSTNGGSQYQYFLIYQDGVDIMHTTGGVDLTHGSSGPYTIGMVTITGLTNGQVYNFTISSHNAAGESPKSIPRHLVPGTIPGAPTGLTATPGVGQVLLNWTAPSFNGGWRIESYLVEQDGVPIWTVGGNNITVTGLTNGQTYNFTVCAQNNAGNGPPSSGVLATPRPDISSEPTNLAVTPGNEQVELSWTPPGYDGGAAIDYFVIYQNNVDVQHNTTTSGTITGLTNGQSYSFTVAAHSSAGMGANSSPINSIPYTVPDVPTGFAGILGNGNITLSWTAPVFDGGRGIDYYVVYQNGVALPYHLSGPSTIIPGLVKDQAYSFTVSAHNQAGMGQQSNTVSITPSETPTVPGAPTGLIAVPGSTQMSLTWTAPISNGGAAIDYYIVYQNGTDIAHPTPPGQIAAGLTNGVSYTFTVAAHNAAGIGPQSSGVSATPIAQTTVPIVAMHRSD